MKDLTYGVYSLISYVMITPDRNVHSCTGRGSKKTIRMKCRYKLYVRFYKVYLLVQVFTHNIGNFTTKAFKTQIIYISIWFVLYPISCANKLLIYYIVQTFQIARYQDMFGSTYITVGCAWIFIETHCHYLSCQYLCMGFEFIVHLLEGL